MSMNKLFALLLVFACSVFSHGADTAKEDIFLPLNTHEPGRTEINLVAHVFPPFQYKQNGKMVGPFIEIMRRVCDEAIVNCVVHMHAFKDAYKDVLDGEADVIFTFLLADDKERQELFAYSPPMVVTRYSFFTTSTSNWKWNGNIADLNNRTIGVYGPSGTQMIARDLVTQNPTAKLEVEETNLKAFQQLVIGRYGQQAAVISNKDVGLALLKNSNIQGPKWAGDINTAVFGFGFSHKSKNFDVAPRMFTAVQLLKDRGVVQSILKTSGLEPAP